MNAPLERGHQPVVRDGHEVLDLTHELWLIEGKLALPRAFVREGSDASKCLEAAAHSIRSAIAHIRSGALTQIDYCEVAMANGALPESVGERGAS